MQQPPMHPETLYGKAVVAFVIFMMFFIGGTFAAMAAGLWAGGIRITF